jgi:hypothetical protein
VLIINNIRIVGEVKFPLSHKSAIYIILRRLEVENGSCVFEMVIKLAIIMASNTVDSCVQ